MSPLWKGRVAARRAQLTYVPLGTDRAFRKRVTSRSTPGRRDMRRRSSWTGAIAVVMAVGGIAVGSNSCSDDLRVNADQVGLLDGPREGGVVLPEGGETTGVYGDGEIAAITMVAHQGEIDQATLAQARATNTAVRDFAADMVAEHQAAIDRGSSLLRTLGIAPTTSKISEDLNAEYNAIVAALESVSVADFDRAYAAAQVTRHTRIVSLIDEVLFPAAEAAEMQSELMTMRATALMHLDHARALVTSLVDGGAGPSGGDGAAD